MGYQDRDQAQAAGDLQAAVPPVVEVRTPFALLMFGIMVRLLGVVILIVGLVVGLRVVDEAWGLYQDPSRIERFADAINSASNLDAQISAALPTAVTDAGDQGNSDAGQAQPPFRLSYFLAWLIGPILMLIVSSIAMSAVSTGGRLALHDLVGDQISRNVRREFERGRRRR